MIISDLLLLSGNDIPFPEAQVTIHQPTLKEIAYIGEEAFFIGCGFLDFSKDLLNIQDKSKLENIHDFEIFMMIITNRSPETRKSIDCAFSVLTLLFPLYQVGVRTDAIVLIKESKEYCITKDNFDEFKKMVSQIFNLGLGKNKKSEQYNPTGDMAKRIAEKFQKRHETLLKIQNESGKKQKIAILSRYASILAVGLQKDLNAMMNYTVSQLYDEFQRFQLKMQWDAYVQARMAGAKDLEEVDNWMIDLDDQGKNNKKNNTKKK